MIVLESIIRNDFLTKVKKSKDILTGKEIDITNVQQLVTLSIMMWQKRALF